MDHMQFLMVRAHDADENISGHALMATAPPDAHIANCPEEKYPHQMPDGKMPDTTLIEQGLNLLRGKLG